MSEQPYTPGSWDIDPEEPRVVVAVDENGDAEPVAEAWYRPDARLIAAAPDMHSLLLDLVDVEGPLPGNAEWARRVRDLLASLPPRP